MAEKIVFPRLDQDMDDGILAGWLVAVGDRVKAGEEIAEIETAKVNATVESPVDGVVLALLAEERDVVPVGAVIAVIGQPGEAIPDLPQAAAVAAPAPAETVRTKAAAPEDGRPAPPTSRVMALPVDRSAWERPHSLSPRARFEAGTKAEAPEREAGRRVPLTSVQQGMVRTVEASWQIPQFSLEADVSTVALTGMLESAQEMFPDAGVTVTDVLIVAMARAIRLAPGVNAWFEGDAVRIFDTVDVSLMIQTDRGLLAPALRGIHGASVIEVAERRRQLVQDARAGTLTSDDLKPGTIALSNLGMHQIDRFNAILFPPLVAVLAVGRIRAETPGAPMWLTLTVDHRAVDGVTAARYLANLSRLLANPGLLSI